MHLTTSLFLILPQHSSEPFTAVLLGGRQAVCRVCRDDDPPTALKGAGPTGSEAGCALAHHGLRHRNQAVA